MRYSFRLTLVLLLFAATGCANSGGAEVRQPPGGGNNGSGQVAMADVAAESPITVGLMTLCVEGADTGDVVDVVADGDGAVEVTAFAIQDEGNIGAARSSLADLGIDTGDHEVRSRCGADGTDGYSEMLVEVVRHTSESAMIDGFTVRWAAGDASGDLTIDYPHWVCAPGDVTGSETCLPSANGG